MIETKFKIGKRLDSPAKVKCPHCKEQELLLYEKHTGHGGVSFHFSCGNCFARFEAMQK